ncbi:DUF4276 family protein [Campylobacter lari]|nr:DUF4276 family protein [Campylobacter lari]
MNKIPIFIEGGGKRNLNISLRLAFRELMNKYEIDSECFDIVAGKSRSETIKSYQDDPREIKVLLVDSETIIKEGVDKFCHIKKCYPKINFKEKDKKNIFFMVVCMESWIVSDINCVKEYFGKGFKENKINNINIVNKDKDYIFKMIDDSTKECKIQYKKNISFEILSTADVNKIVSNNCYAKEFFDFLKYKKFLDNANCIKDN